jgi:predicted PurR-regulated permease PerM
VVVEVAEEQAGLADQVVAGLASAGGALGAALILAVFMLASGDFYHRRIVEAMPRLRDKKQALTIIRDVERQISRYLGAIFLINAALGVAVGVAMWLLGVPLAVVWGLLAFLLNFIPFVGNVLNLVLVAAVSLVTFDTLWDAALPPLVLAGLMLLESNVLTPILIGRRLELNTVSQLVMVAFWTWLWGVPGAILAVPFLVVVKAVCDNVESLQTLGSFLSGDPSTHPHEAPQKATTGPALGSAPLRTQAEAREDSPPGEAPGEGRTLAEAARGAHPLPL